LSALAPRRRTESRATPRFGTPPRVCRTPTPRARPARTFRAGRRQRHVGRSQQGRLHRVRRVAQRRGDPAGFGRRGAGARPHENVRAGRAEALACGTPAVVSRTSALPEILSSDSGASADNHPLAIAGAVSAVMNRPEVTTQTRCAAAARRASPGRGRGRNAQRAGRRPPRPHRCAGKGLVDPVNGKSPVTALSPATALTKEPPWRPAQSYGSSSLSSPCWR